MVRKTWEADVHARRTQAGFTLFELVIVLVIASLLLAFVLQGSSLRREAYVKDLVSMVKDLSEATRQYRERYHYLPGDHHNAEDDLPRTSGEKTDCGKKGGALAGNGLINNVSAGGRTESYCAPLHLARAGLIRDQSLPITRQFGDVQVKVTFVARSEAKVQAVSNYPKVVQNVLELEGVTYSLAARLDEMLDDGHLATGKVQAFNEDGSPVVAPQDRTPVEDPEITVVPYLAIPLL